MRSTGYVRLLLGIEICQRIDDRVSLDWVLVFECIHEVDVALQRGCYRAAV